MVKRLLSPAFLFLVLASLATTLQAGELQVEPDRTQLYEGEVLTLTVTGSTKIDINLSNLFDFNLSDLPSPDIEKVEPDFDILARNQHYSVQTVNGEMTGEITWTYQLAPKKTGKLTIPPLTFKDSTSKPVTIDVISGTPPDQGASGQASRHGFIELSADKDELYVQEQLVLTIRLFFNGNLIRGELSEPEAPDAIVEPLGKQREFSRYRDGVRYRVVERKYALFPQQPGTFSLPPIRFEGQARNADGQLMFLRDSQQLFDIPVKDIPASFTGDTWLPASKLTLTEAGLPATMQVATGDNLTRSLTLKADGLPSEALPPLPEATPDGLRSYPDKPARSTEATPTGLTSTLNQTTALVPVKPGTMELPEIRIPWWNTTTDQEQVAVIPAQTLTVSASASAPAATGTPGNVTGGPDHTAASDTPKNTSEQATESSNQAVGNAQARSPDSMWQWISLTLIVLWLLTMAAWWQSRRKSSRQSPLVPHDQSEQEKPAFDRLRQAAEQGAPSTPVLLTQWMNIRFPGHHFHTASEAASFSGDTELQTELANLQAHLFAANAPSATENPWNADALISALERIRKKTPAVQRSNGLAPLYPDGLSN